MLILATSSYYHLLLVSRHECILGGMTASQITLAKNKLLDTVQPWISHEGPWILCLSLMERPFGQNYVFSWNLACVPFSHDGLLEWDSFC